MRKFKHFDDKGMEPLLRGPIVVEEKLNVFPVKFWKEADKVLIYAPKGLPAASADHLKSMPDRMIDGWEYWAGSPYGYPIAAKNGLVLFDVTKGDPNYYANWSHKNMIAESLEIGAPQVVYEGRNPLKPKLYDFLHTPSALGGGNVSGLVIKNYDLVDKGGEVLMGKLEGLCS